jgi:mannitol/fructose-specific phosphotransferase system IIA component
MRRRSSLISGECMSQLFVRTGIEFSSCQQALAHIGEEMLAKGVVHDSYPAALLEREAIYPTGSPLNAMPLQSRTARRLMQSQRQFILFDRINQ